MKRILLAVESGNVLEWYDFMLYGAFAPVFAQLFFPKSALYTQIILVFAILAVGYLMRPLGGLLIGYIGDQFSRRLALIISILLMAIPTLLMALLPTYQQIGIYAALLFALLRIIQGFSVGGELPGAMVILNENSPAKLRYFYTSFALLGVYIGMVLGAIAATLILHYFSRYQLLSWGWRVPYLASIFLALPAIYARVYLLNIAGIYKNKNPQHSPIVDTFSTLKKKIIKIMGTQSLSAVGFGIILLFMPTYLAYLHLVNLHTAQKIILILLLISIILLPIFALISDRIQNKTLLIISCVGFILLSYPLFLLMKIGFIGICFSVFLLGTLLSMYLSSVTKAMVSYFPASSRYTAVALVHSLTFSIFVGTSPMLAMGAIRLFHNVSAPAFILMAASSVALISLYSIIME